MIVGLTGKYLPAHPKPFADESISSWIIRTIRANIGDQPLHRFCRLEFGASTPIWTRDIDRNLQPEVLTTLAQRTGVTVQRLKELSLDGYAGLVFERHNSSGDNKWILPIGVYHRKRKLFGQQWCPLCLKEDNIPYYRRHWRMAFSTCCLKHGRLLLDRCAECSTPCMPHRGGFFDCSTCGASLVDQHQYPAESMAMQAQYILQSRSLDGLTSFDFRQPLQPIAFFDIWYQLLKLVFFSKRAALLRKHIIDSFGGWNNLNADKSQIKSLEYLSSRDRHVLLGLVARLTTGWPFLFIGLCADSTVWSSCILKDMKPNRYELWKVARTYLSRPITPRPF